MVLFFKGISYDNQIFTIPMLLFFLLFWSRCFYEHNGWNLNKFSKLVLNRFINNHNEFDNLLLQRLYTENKREKIALLDGNLKSNSTWYTLWVHIVHFIYHLHSRLYCLPLMLRVFPPKRKHSQSSGRGVLEASTNTFTLLMSIPRRSKMGWIEALSKRFKIHIFSL